MKGWVDMANLIKLTKISNEHVFIKVDAISAITPRGDSTNIYTLGESLPFTVKEGIEEVMRMFNLSCNDSEGNDLGDS